MSAPDAKTPQVLIAGAGPTGLVLAIWLTHLGVPVRIIDAAAQPGTTSRALGVQARTLELYRQVGLADPVVEESVRVEALNLWVRGRRAARAPITEMGKGLSPYPYICIYAQDVHERMLIQHLRDLGVEVERPTELLRFDQTEAGVTAVLRRANGSEETCEAAYLAGCDGASSTVRKTLGVGFGGGTYAGRFYVADVEAEGAAGNEIHVDLEEAEFLAVFPLKGEAHLRLIGAVSWEPDERGDGLTWDDVSQRAIDNLRFHVRQVNWFSTYRVHHRVAERFQVGRVFLLGDAAHVHSPVGAQGMNTGIGDAINLAWKLAAVLKGEAAGWLVDTYEPERIAFARRLVATTDRVFSLVTRQGPLARFVRTRVVPRLVPALFARRAVRRFLFRTISQIEIRYRHSPLSSGLAGRLHAGDRLPWVSIGEGADNFDQLTSVGWSVHTYGDLPPGLLAACIDLRLPLAAFGWREGMGAAGLQQSALYLVRPDGYLGLVDPDANPVRLRAYWEKLRDSGSKQGVPLAPAKDKG